MNKKLYEAQGGNVDKLYAQLDKADSAIQKAQAAVLDAADAMDAILVEAVTIGGSLAQTIPSHIKMHIAKLTEIADKQLGEISNGNSQSSINKLKELVENTPYRELKTVTPQARRDQIAGQPNVAAPDLSGGTQSQISESLEQYYESLGEKGYYQDKSFSFERLGESDIYGQKLEEDMMYQLGMRKAAPIQESRKIQERIRASVNDEFFEDQEELQESGPLDFSKIRAFGGADGMPVSFSNLSDGYNVVGDGIK